MDAREAPTRSARRTRRPVCRRRSSLGCLFPLRAARAGRAAHHRLDAGDSAAADPESSMAKTIAELTAIAHQHAAAEADGDLAATLATLEADPVYELYPVGLRMTGMDRWRAGTTSISSQTSRRGSRATRCWANGSTSRAFCKSIACRVRYDDDRCAISASLACSSSATPRSPASGCTPTRSSCGSSSSRCGASSSPLADAV